MSNYARAISEPWWKALRWQVLGERAGGVCESCHREFATQVHHLHYPVGRREQARDLMAVCDGCHYSFHHPVAANDNFEQEEFEI
jgi:hypothetical protein